MSAGAALPFSWLECTACHTWLPATPGFFGARQLAGDALRCLCLECEARGRQTSTPAGVAPDAEAEQACARCESLWPRTAEFFRPLSPGLLHTVCRACESEARLRRADRPHTEPAAHDSDAIAPLLTGAHFFQGAMR